MPECPPQLGGPTSRRGVTLIELLVVILIISILAALVLGVAAVAGETARQAQTKHTVERLHTLLTDFYDTFKTRRVKLNPQVEKDINAFTSRPAERRQLLAEARLYALRELMLMEVPDRWSDTIFASVGGTDASPPLNPPNPLTSQYQPIYLNARTELANAYLRRYRGLVGRTNTVTGVANTTGDLLADQGAECLYMIITMACGDGEARSQFKEADIGDTDGDGAPEFLDGWGHPINFLRWAPGFDSQIQMNANNYRNAADAEWVKDAAKDHDPFDIYRVEQASSGKDGDERAAAFRLTPLIFSGGRDETFGIRLVKPYVTWRNNNPPAGVMMRGYPRLSPYYQIPDPDDSGAMSFLGTMNADGTATDNIHNHLLGLR